VRIQDYVPAAHGGSKAGTSGSFAGSPASLETGEKQEATTGLGTVVASALAAAFSGDGVRLKPATLSAWEGNVTRMLWVSADTRNDCRKILTQG
jgi:hypothetical protein